MQTIIDRSYLNHPIDTGCNKATDYLGEQSLCIDCPFSLCIKDIKYSTLLLLQNKTTIQQIYNAYKSGLTLDKITKLFSDIPTSTIQYWIKHIKRIQSLLREYSWVIPYI